MGCDDMALTPATPLNFSIRLNEILQPWKSVWGKIKFYHSVAHITKNNPSLGSFVLCHELD